MTLEDSKGSLELYQMFSGGSTPVSEPLYMKSYSSKVLSSQQSTVLKEKGKGVRFLYSPTSRILSIHYFNLLPYMNSEVHLVN